MGRSRIGWAVSVAAPWCVAFAVLVSITAEAGQEPTELTSAFARSQLPSASALLERPIASSPLRAVDEDGEPVPIVQARRETGDRQALTADPDGIEPNAALKGIGRPFPAVDRGARAIRSSVLRASMPNASTKGALKPRPTRSIPGRTSWKIRATTNSIPDTR